MSEGSRPEALGSRLPMIETDLVQRLRRLSNRIWRTVQGWTTFAKQTTGQQLVNCMDSIGANLVEGDGRATEPDAIRFFVIARGSLREADYWLMLACDRELLDQQSFSEHRDELNQLLRMLNAMISHRQKSRPVSRVREDLAPYYVEDGEALEPRALSLEP